MIDIKRLDFRYRNNIIFQNLNLNFEKNQITTILGSNGSGKSTLVKILVGLLKFDGNIKIDGVFLNRDNIKDIRKKIGVVFENPDNQFIAETVMDDIAFTLENMGYDKKVIREKIYEITSYLNIKHILESNPHFLSNGEKQLVALASALVHDPKILILDEALTYVDNNDKKEIYQIFKDLKNKGLTIINITHDIEETLFSDKIVVLGDNKVIFNGNRDDFYNSTLNQLGFEYPFIVDLSNKLMFYDLIDKRYYDMEELVDALWK